MNKKAARRRIVGFAVVVGLVLAGGCGRETGPTAEQIAIAYMRVNETFRMGETPYFVDPSERFAVLDDGTPVNVMIMALEFNQQNWRAGRHVVPREIARFFENEFEPDGSLRLYNNGLHPEVQLIVEQFHHGMPGFREMGLQSFLEFFGSIYYGRIRAALNGAVPDNPDFPMNLGDVRQAEIWLAMFQLYRDRNYPLDLREILEPIYGWPE